MQVVPVAVPADSVATVGKFRAPDEGEGAGFLVLTLRTDHGTFVNDWHFGKYRDMPLSAAKIARSVRQAGDGRFEVELSTDAPAFFVWANVREVRGEFDDNCFTLLPKRPRTLAFEAKEPVSAEEGPVSSRQT